MCRRSASYLWSRSRSGFPLTRIVRLRRPQLKNAHQALAQKQTARFPALRRARRASAESRRVMITLHASEFHLVPPGQISDDESGCDCGLRFDRGWGEWRVRLWILSGVLLAAIVVAGWAMLEREHQTKWLAAYHEASDSFDR